MTETERRRWLDGLTCLIVELADAGGVDDLPLLLNSKGLPSFALLTPGAFAYTVGDADVMLRVADLLGAFETGDCHRAAELMGVPPQGMS